MTNFDKLFPIAVTTAQQILYGYLFYLLKRLETLVKELEEKSDSKNYFQFPKALYFAEMFNNEIDAFTNFWLTSSNSELAGWRNSEEFKQAWGQLKKERDELYARLIKIVKAFPQEDLDKNMSLYTSFLSRFTRPPDLIPRPPKL